MTFTLSTDFVINFIAWYISLCILILPVFGTVKLIKAIFRKLRSKNKKEPIQFKPNNTTKEDLTHSQDWLTRAQARQEIRFQNSLPPQRSEQKPQKKTWSMRRNEKKGKSAMGWVYNEETQLWEPPKHLKK